MNYRIVFAPDAPKDELIWKLFLGNARLGAFTSEADANLFVEAIEKSRLNAEAQ